MSAYTVAQPVGKRASGRRWRLVLGVVVLVVTGLVVADRLLVRVVEHRLATRLACVGTLGGGVAVHIGGFPFLAEVVTGHVASARVDAGSGGPGGRLTGVRIDIRDLRLPAMTGLVRPGNATKLTIGSATFAATVPYGALRGLVGSGAARARTGEVGGTTAAGPGSAGGLPFDAHLDAATPGAGGVRVQMSIAGAAFDRQAAARRSCGGS
jgi:LmeA-like phospholipid-binding